MRIIPGYGTDEVYERMLALFEDTEAPRTLFNVVCRIAEATQAEVLPTAYPEIAGVEHSTRQEWFEDLVSWWQRPQSSASESLQFTHGSRIRTHYAYDQVEHVIKLLQDDERSSRAIVSLFDPKVDLVDETRHKFPSFCLVQFMIRRTIGDIPHLDCTGYFRKQELRYWWPINVAEIAMLQKEVFNRLVKAGRSNLANLKLGSLTTVAAVASIGDSPPQVLVPKLDRALDEDRNNLWAMVYALFRANLTAQDRIHIEEQWENYLSDLIPAEVVNPDGVPVSIAGVSFVFRQVELFASHHSGEQYETLIEHLNTLLEVNKDYLRRMSDNGTSQAEHTTWRNAVNSAVRDIQRDIRSIFATLSSQQSGG